MPMQQDQVMVDGCAIHYRQAGPLDAPPVLLIHGNSMSGRCFDAQLTSELTQSLRLIAVDLPGHGQSSRMQLSDYNIPAYARRIAACADTLNAADAVMVGWSLGGHIALQATQYLPHASGLMLLGTPPLSKLEDALTAFLPNPDSVVYKDNVTADEARAFARACLHPDSELDCAAMVEDVLATDGEARIGLLQPDVAFTDEVDLVRTLKIPLAVVHGAGEQLVSLDYLRSLELSGLWRNAIVVLPGVGHTPHLEAPVLFNQLLSDFAADCQTGA